MSLMKQVWLDQRHQSPVQQEEHIVDGERSVETEPAEGQDGGDHCGGVLR